MTKEAHGQINAFNHASHVPQLMSYNYYNTNPFVCLCVWNLKNMELVMYKLTYGDVCVCV